MSNMHLNMNLNMTFCSRDMLGFWMQSLGPPGGSKFACHKLSLGENLCTSPIQECAKFEANPWSPCAVFFGKNEYMLTRVKVQFPKFKCFWMPCFSMSQSNNW